MTMCSARLERIGKSFEVGAAKLFRANSSYQQLPCVPRWTYSLAATALRPRASPSNKKQLLVGMAHFGCASTYLPLSDARA